jgi:hypothetical protein
MEMIVNDRERPPSIDAWHTDLTWQAQPPMGTAIQITETPPMGGNTCWVSTSKAFAALSPGLRVYLEGLTATHTWEVSGFRDALARRGGDALVTLDGDRWGDFSPRQQRAILDHELTHLELVVSDEGGVEGDDIGRPRLRLRKHDHQFGWFDAVVRRHGANSVEWSQFKAFEGTALKQSWLPGFEASDHGDLGEVDEDNSDAGFTKQVGDMLEKAVEGTGVKLHRNVVVTRTPGVTKTRGRKAAANR